jgi:hypothetical protein
MHQNYSTVFRHGKQDRKYTCNLTFRCIRIFASGTLLRQSYNSIHCRHTFCYSAELCTCYRIILVLLDPVIMVVSELIICTAT